MPDVVLVVLVVMAIALVWLVAAVATALLAGSVIHERDHHDVPYGGAPLPLVR